MAKVTANQFVPKGTTKRKGVHAKSKTSKNVNSKNYVKAYGGQGR
jgi:hypothetical protein|tara:strand:+ start:569 stop:703 length:135 start_codon:yes stop_codon:yes gene_type:complete